MKIARLLILFAYLTGVLMAQESVLPKHYQTTLKKWFRSFYYPFKKPKQCYHNRYFLQSWKSQ